MNVVNGVECLYTGLPYRSVKYFFYIHTCHSKLTPVFCMSMYFHFQSCFKDANRFVTTECCLLHAVIVKSATGKIDYLNQFPTQCDTLYELPT